ncbi:MAG: polysaccharide biosynthesis tyrosine autokinase [Planctomycetes bacterium]|nr:polysaccharide biosynthesis tyrosine autokinase [Planctomycetota bacterium]
MYKDEEQSVPFYAGFLNTQVARIRSPLILQHVLDQPKVRQTNWYREKPTLLLRSPRTSLERLKDGLSVSTRRGTELIEIAMISRSGSDAATIANAVASEYVKYSQESVGSFDVERKETLTNKINDFEKKIKTLLAIRSNLLPPGVADPERHLVQLETRLRALEFERDSLLRKHRITLQGLNSGTPIENTENDEHQQDDGDVPATELHDAEQSYSFDPEWRQLHIARERASQRLALERGNYGERHPLIKGLVAEVEFAEKRLAERQAQLDDQPEEQPEQVALAPGIQPEELQRAALRREAEDQQRLLEELDNVIAFQLAESQRFSETARSIAEYDEALHNVRTRRDEYQLRLQVLELESEAPERISVTSVAVEPTQPYRDRRVVFSVMALAAAMGVGLALGYVRTSLSPRILQAEDVERTIHAPFLGQLPAISVAEDSQLHADPLLLESIRMVRTALWRRLHDGDLQVVLLTSCSGQAGKSTVVALLARSMAELGKKVLLIEADLRRPSLSRRLLGHESQMGLAAVLAGSTTDMNAIVPTDVPNFDVLVAGRQPDDFTFELLANGRFAECLSRWKKKYDVLLLDSPPLRSCADARILADHADGTIMVVRASHCRRDEVVRACADLSSSGGTLLGTVLIGGRDRLDYSADYVYGTDNQHSREREALSEVSAPPNDHSTPD